MRFPRFVVLTFVLLLASPAVAVGSASFDRAPTGAFSGDTATAGSATGTTVGAWDDGSPDCADPWQVIRLAITEDGDAEWTVESRYAVESEDDADAFEDFASSAQDNESGVGLDLNRLESFVDAAAVETDRQMVLENAGWDEPRIEPENTTPSPENETVGVLSQTFTWTNFAEVDGTEIHVGDAFHVDGEPLFGSLADGQQLLIERPPNTGYDTLPPSGTGTSNGAVWMWVGPHEFDTDDLQLTYLIGGTIDEYSVTALLEADDGTPLEDTTVTLRGPDGEEWTTETDATGAGTFEGLPDGEYTLVVEDDEQTLEEDVTIDSADESVSFTLETSEETHTVTAIVEDADGEPIAGASVTLTGPDGEAWTAETDADGEVTFEGLPDGEYTASVDADDQVLEEPITIDGDDESVTLAPDALQGEHTLTATVEDADGEPLASASVTLTGPDGAEWTAETDADGEVAFEGLPDGEYTLSVEDGDETQTVALDGGDETVTLTHAAAGGETGLGGLSAALLLLGIVGVGTLVGAYVAFSRRRTHADDEPSAGEPSVSASSEPDTASSKSERAPSNSDTVPSEPDEPSAPGESRADDDSSHATTAPSTDDTEATVTYNESSVAAGDGGRDGAGVDVELLSDEERVLRLLRQNNGRMKQASIVTETDWSNAKVSQLLSKMDDDDEIDKLRIGRENLITLPEIDPTAVD